MRIKRKLLKRLTKKPYIRPRIIKSLTAFDENINNEQNTKLIANRQNSDTINLLRYLIQKADNNGNFNLKKRDIINHFLFNKISLNFNFAALHQLRMIQIDWNYFKSTPNVKGYINAKIVF